MIDFITGEVSDLLAYGKLITEEYEYIKGLIEQEEAYTEEQREIVDDLYLFYF